MKPPAADNQSEIERRLARRRFCALATPAALAVLLLGTAVTTQARSLATTVLRDAHILAGDSDPALADNHVAHQRRPAGLAGGYAVAGAPGGKAGKPDPFPAGPAAGQQPVAPDSSATAVAPATSSAPTSTTPPVVEEPSTPPVEPEPTPPPSEPEPTPPVEPEPEPTPPPSEPEPPTEPEPPPKSDPEPPVVDPAEPVDPEPEPPPSTPAKDPIFEGAELDDFDEIQAAPGAITEVPDPLGSGETVFQFTVDEGDVFPITPTENPRAQALSPDVIEAGDEIWLKTKFMLPQDFPEVNGWMALVSIYGPPFQSSSPWQIGVEGNKFSWMRNGTYHFDVPWEAPLRKGVWISVLLHERFAADGWVEMWIDGQQVTFFPGKSTAAQRLEMQTMDSSNNDGPNSAKIMQYREAGMFETGTLYFGALTFGDSRESVGG